MSKRPSTSASDESGNNPSVAKFMCITENDNKILCKYFEVLQETANKFKMQNANSPQEQNAIHVWKLITKMLYQQKLKNIMNRKS